MSNGYSAPAIRTPALADMCVIGCQLAETSSAAANLLNSTWVSAQIRDLNWNHLLQHICSAPSCSHCVLANRARERLAPYDTAYANYTAHCEGCEQCARSVQAAIDTPTVSSRMAAVSRERTHDALDIVLRANLPPLPPPARRVDPQRQFERGRRRFFDAMQVDKFCVLMEIT